MTIPGFAVIGIDTKNLKVTARPIGSEHPITVCITQELFDDKPALEKFLGIVLKQELEFQRGVH